MFKIMFMTRTKYVTMPYFFLEVSTELISFHVPDVVDSDRVGAAGGTISTTEEN